MAAKTVTIETFTEIEDAERLAVEAAREASAKALKAKLKDYDFAAEETSLIEGLRNLYRIHFKAKEILGDKHEFRPSHLTAAIRGVPTKAPKSSGGGGGGGGRGEKTAAVIEVIKASTTPMTAKEIAEKLGEAEPNVRQRLFKLVEEGTLVSLKKDGENFRKPKPADGKKKGERGGYYSVAAA